MVANDKWVTIVAEEKYRQVSASMIRMSIPMPTCASKVEDEFSRAGLAEGPGRRASNSRRHNLKGIDSENIDSDRCAIC